MANATSAPPQGGYRYDDVRAFYRDGFHWSAAPRSEPFVHPPAKGHFSNCHAEYCRRIPETEDYL